MMKAILRWLKKRRLQKAQRKYAYKKARRDAFLTAHRGVLCAYEFDYANMCAEEAYAMERVEQLMRD